MIRYFLNNKQNLTSFSNIAFISKTIHTISANFNETLSLSCNSSAIGSNQTISWIGITESQSLYYLSEIAGHLQFANNGKELNILNLAFSDQMYYVCGVLENNLPVILNQYFVTTRSMKFFIIILISFINLNNN